MKSHFCRTLTISLSLGTLSGCDMPSVINLFSNNTATASGSVQVNVDKDAADKIANALSDKTNQGSQSTNSANADKLDKIVDKLDEIASKSAATPQPRLQSFRARGPKQYTEQSNDIAAAFGREYDALFPAVNIVHIVKQDKLGMVVRDGSDYGLFCYNQASDSYTTVEATVSSDIIGDNAKLFAAANEGAQDDADVTLYSEKSRDIFVGSGNQKGFTSLHLPSTWDAFGGSAQDVSLLFAVGKELVFLAPPNGGAPYFKDIKFINPWIGDYQSSNLNKAFGGKIVKVIFADGIFWYLVRVENAYSVWGATEQQIRQSQL